MKKFAVIFLSMGLFFLHASDEVKKNYTLEELEKILQETDPIIGDVPYFAEKREIGEEDDLELFENKRKKLETQSSLELFDLKISYNKEVYDTGLALLTKRVNNITISLKDRLNAFIYFKISGKNFLDLYCSIFNKCISMISTPNHFKSLVNQIGNDLDDCYGGGSDRFIEDLTGIVKKPVLLESKKVPDTVIRRKSHNAGVVLNSVIEFLNINVVGQIFRVNKNSYDSSVASLKNYINSQGKHNFVSSAENLFKIALHDHSDPSCKLETKYNRGDYNDLLKSVDVNKLKTSIQKTREYFVGKSGNFTDFAQRLTELY